MNESNRRRSRPQVGAIAVLCAVALLAAACSSGSNNASTSTTSGVQALPNNTQGVTSNSISIGTTTPLTGPAAPGYSEIAPAANAYFKYVNAHGGVAGRQINYTVLNDQYDPSQTATLTRQ